MVKAAVVGALALLRAVDLFQFLHDLECAADVGLGPDEILVLRQATNSEEQTREICGEISFVGPIRKTRVSCAANRRCCRMPFETSYVPGTYIRSAFSVPHWWAGE